MIAENGGILAALAVTTSAPEAWEFHVFDLFKSTPTSALVEIATEKANTKEKLMNCVSAAEGLVGDVEVKHGFDN